MLVGRLAALETPSEDALPRNVLRSESSAETLIPALMCVAFAPPTLSLPATVG